MLSQLLYSLDCCDAPKKSRAGADLDRASTAHSFHHLVRSCREERVLARRRRGDIGRHQVCTGRGGKSRGVKVSSRERIA